MITASEAKTLVESGQYILNSQALKMVEGKINEAVSLGLYYFTGEGVLPNALIEYLRELGYKCSSKRYDSGEFFTITWR